MVVFYVGNGVEEALDIEAVNYLAFDPTTGEIRVRYVADSGLNAPFEVPASDLYASLREAEVCCMERKIQHLRAQQQLVNDEIENLQKRLAVVKNELERKKYE